MVGFFSAPAVNQHFDDVMLPPIVTRSVRFAKHVRHVGARDQQAALTALQPSSHPGSRVLWIPGFREEIYPSRAQEQGSRLRS
jgi:hypothetical protein